MLHLWANYKFWWSSYSRFTKSLYGVFGSVCEITASDYIVLALISSLAATESSESLEDCLLVKIIEKAQGKWGNECSFWDCETQNEVISYVFVDFFLSIAYSYDLIVITFSQIANRPYQILLAHAFILIATVGIYWSLFCACSGKVIVDRVFYWKTIVSKEFIANFWKNLSWPYAILFYYFSTIQQANSKQ